MDGECLSKIEKIGDDYWVWDEVQNILVEVCDSAQEAFDYCVTNDLQPTEVYIK